MTATVSIRHRFRPRASSRQRIIRGAVGFATVFLVAEILTRAELVNPLFLPPFSHILATAGGLLVDPAFLTDIGATLAAAGIGLGLAIVIAVPLGVLFGSSHALYITSRGLVEFMRPIPSVALIPVAILMLGQHLEMKVFLVAYASSWPLLFNTIYGVHDVDPLSKDTGRIYGYTRFDILARVALPSAAPFIYTGIRFGVSIALIVTISAELLAAAGDGIGTFILVMGQTGQRYDAVYAATIITGLIGWICNWLLARGERRFFRWNPELRGETP